MHTSLHRTRHWHFEKRPSHNLNSRHLLALHVSYCFVTQGHACEQRQGDAAEFRCWAVARCQDNGALHQDNLGKAKGFDNLQHRLSCASDCHTFLPSNLCTPLSTSNCCQCRTLLPPAMHGRYCRQTTIRRLCQLPRVDAGPRRKPCSYAVCIMLRIPSKG